MIFVHKIIIKTNTSINLKSNTNHSLNVIFISFKAIYVTKFEAFSGIINAVMLHYDKILANNDKYGVVM